jgi:hypothetical protein
MGEKGAFFSFAKKLLCAHGAFSHLESKPRRIHPDAVDFVESDLRLG